VPEDWDGGKEHRRLEEQKTDKRTGSSHRHRVESLGHQLVIRKGGGGNSHRPGNVEWEDSKDSGIPGGRG